MISSSLIRSDYPAPRFPGRPSGVSQILGRVLLLTAEENRAGAGEMDSSATDGQFSGRALPVFTALPQPFQSSSVVQTQKEPR